MAHTAHKSEAEKKEFFDPEEVLQEKVAKLADLVLNSKHFVAFTGAGISTACGIPDFRSGVNTVLGTGPGAWEKKAQKVESKPNKNIVEMTKAIPSFTHMAFVALEEAGLLKFLVSQNTDGLHMRSGFDTRKLAELHGNRCLEKCKKCGSQFLRDFRTRESQKVHEHQTSRKCEKCKGVLEDSIINFGENLPEYELNKSFEEAEAADLCLAMGSSLTVTPAADIPKLVSKKGKLIIVNLQATPLDKYAYLRINGLCDDVMRRLAAQLQLKVRDFILKRLISFRIAKESLEFRGIDRRGVPFTFFKEVSAKTGNGKEKLKGEPYSVNFKEKGPVTVAIEFYKYLGEPNLEISFEKPQEGTYSIEYDPRVGEWTKREWVELQPK
jgi:NAD-dependent SIR2 family protein deacetylase